MLIQKKKKKKHYFKTENDPRSELKFKVESTEHGFSRNVCDVPLFTVKFLLVPILFFFSCYTFYLTASVLFVDKNLRNPG